jgi:hypothetical protein
MATTEYRVLPVTRWIITRYHATRNSVSVGPLCEFDNEAMAHQVLAALKDGPPIREELPGESRPVALDERHS